jgi:hypothetical protein
MKTPNLSDGSLELIVGGYTITSPEPHIIHINKIFPQKQAAWGGEERLVPQLGVWLKFFNETVKKAAEEEKARQEAEEVQKRADAPRELIEKLGVVGKTITSVDYNNVRTIVMMDDGTELTVWSGQLNSIRPTKVQS